MGNREGFLLKAVVELSAWGVCEALSHIVESEPWGFVSANSFLNMGVLLRSDLTPEALLDRLHAIERKLGSTSHRDSRGGYADRNVDIDIMAAENETGEGVKIDSELLTLPHPHLHDRKFFIDPYRELKAASEKRK